MDLNLKSKIVLVTGSTRGIGFHVASKFLEQGALVLFNGRHKSSEGELKIKLPDRDFFYIAGNVSDPKDSESIAAEIKSRFGALDILVCNVGSGDSVPPGEENYTELHKMLSINLFSSTNIIEATHNLLVNSKGVIVCISSICGREVIEGAPIAYSVSKAALEAYVRGTSRPLAQKGVRINSVCLGNIIFNGSVWETKLIKNKASVQKMLDDRVALAKFGQPEDVANLTLFLSSNLSKFITGSTYVLDGGQVHQ